MNNQDYALGMIETIGFPPLIAALDTASKSADVKLVTYQGADAGLVTIYIVGDVASVRSAVDAGGDMAKTVGQLVSTHVIARPDENTKKMIFGMLAKKESETKKPEKIDDRESTNENESVLIEEYSQKTLQELKEIALSKTDFTMKANQIHKSKKDDLIRQLTLAQTKEGGDR